MVSVTRSTKNSPARRGERREEVEHRVLTAVDRLLAQGVAFTELPVQRIATESDIARSTFYRYFPDKSQLLIRMADLATDDLFRAAAQWWAGEQLSETGAIDAMRDMIAGFTKHRLLLEALVEVASYDREVGRYWRSRVDAFVEMVRRRLNELKEAGRINEEMDVHATAVIVTAMVERVIAGRHRISEGRLAEALGRAIWLTI
ncbi:TetR/AcrR family transcriptional regulator, partial [Aldersonia kunmingensis]|uniref:TetR/AcrR family transcriptional regulator n=1 Tax=Aldersonia kunmingensis TaxID=408066 RepID=UPI0008311B5C